MVEYIGISVYLFLLESSGSLYARNFSIFILTFELTGIKLFTKFPFYFSNCRICSDFLSVLMLICVFPLVFLVNMAETLPIPNLLFSKNQALVPFIFFFFSCVYFCVLIIPFSVTLAVLFLFIFSRWKLKSS